MTQCDDVTHRRFVTTARAHCARSPMFNSLNLRRLGLPPELVSVVPSREPNARPAPRRLAQTAHIRGLSCEHHPSRSF
jgi:hypothetical protein